MKKKLSMAIVEDHPIVIQGLSLLLSKINSVELKASFKNGSDFLSYPELGSIDIVLLDVFLPDMNGIDLCANLKKTYPAIIVLAMSSQSERSIVIEMMKRGANGYLLKGGSLEEFRDCIQLAGEGKAAFSAGIKDIVDNLQVNDLKIMPRLTRREKEVMSLLKLGKSTQEISDALALSFLTVQTHRRNLLSKFQVKNVVELLNYANENGLL